MRSTRDASSLQEKRIARAVGGKTVVNSGATLFKKGDVTHPLVLIDGKTCMSPQKSVTLQKEWFDKIKAEAFAMNKDFGAIAFDFGTDERFYAVSERVFKQFLDRMEE